MPSTLTDPVKYGTERKFAVHSESAVPMKRVDRPNVSSSDESNGWPTTRSIIVRSITAPSENITRAETGIESSGLTLARANSQKVV